MTKRIAHKPSFCALVTGGVERIGRAIVNMLVQRDIAVIAHHLPTQHAAARKFIKSLRAQGATAWSYAADFAQPQSATRLFAQALSSGKQINILINNASIFPSDRFNSLTETSLNKTLKINTVAPLELMQQFSRQCKSGLIINILDTRIHSVDIEHCSYQCSKLLLHELTRMAAVALAPGIRVNSIAPGMILPPPGKTATYLRRQCGRTLRASHGNPRDIATAAGYLIDAEFVTGTVLYVDGGQKVKGVCFGKKI